MSTTIKNLAKETVKKSFSPNRTFFRLSENIPSIQHARAVFKSLGNYGEMVEYKVMRVSRVRVVFIRVIEIYKLIEISVLRHLNIFVMDLLYIKILRMLIELLVINLSRWNLNYSINLWMSRSRKH